MQRQTEDQTPRSALDPRYISSSTPRRTSSYPRALVLLFPLILFLSQKTNPAVKCFHESSEASHLRGKKKKRLPSTAIQESFCSAEQATTVRPRSPACPAIRDRCFETPGGSCSHRDSHISLDNTDAKSRSSLSTLCSKISVCPVLVLVRSW